MQRTIEITDEQIAAAQAKDRVLKLLHQRITDYLESEHLRQLSMEQQISEAHTESRKLRQQIAVLGGKLARRQEFIRRTEKAKGYRRGPEKKIHAQITRRKQIILQNVIRAQVRREKTAFIHEFQIRQGEFKKRQSLIPLVTPTETETPVKDTTTHDTHQIQENGHVQSPV